MNILNNRSRYPSRPRVPFAHPTHNFTPRLTLYQLLRRHECNATRQRREGGRIFVLIGPFSKMRQQRAHAGNSSRLRSPFLFPPFSFFQCLNSLHSSEVLRQGSLYYGRRYRQAGRNTTLSHFPLPQGKHTCVQHMRYRTANPLASDVGK